MSKKVINNRSSSKTFEIKTFSFNKNNKKFEVESTEHPGIFLAKKKNIWKAMTTSASNKQIQGTISALKGLIITWDLMKNINSLHKDVEMKAKEIINKKEFIKQLKLILETRDKKGNINYKEIIKHFANLIVSCHNFSENFLANF